MDTRLYFGRFKLEEVHAVRHTFRGDALVAKLELQVKEIKKIVIELSRKVDILLEERETATMMTLSQEALKDFLSYDPDLYST